MSQYAEMKASFVEAGFHEELCQYSMFDNSKCNIYDPYEVVNDFFESIVEPYIIFCHQDILLDQEDHFSSLVKLLEDLESIDPKWAIAGNAGINCQYELVARITDPNGTMNWTKGFPQRVHSLDENFLVIKSSSKFFSSRDLRGFHFYGSDLCLNAIIKGHSCYVIDFHLTHLSGGSLNQPFWDTQKLFYNNWNNKFGFCYMRTVTDVTMCFSKIKLLRTIGSKQTVMQWFLSHKFLHPLVLPR